MEIWITIAALGGILSLAGIALLVRRYRQGQVTGMELGVVAGTYVLIVAAILVTEVFETRPVGSLFVLVVLPFWFLIVSRARSRAGK